ncbi:uncharacterized protein LOC113501975 [Trichoplusia ni]|uniref:Uncharacterized protein LOC113501975 n=1 Tax=Trichoplusia ni TaxID=7111 RepID=A0A7E5WEI4_TRINI|nr:uncharacterized protein LOC113501975 [Trichoplusia ni]
MIALLLFGLIAGACAAPQFDFGDRSSFSQGLHFHLRPYTDDSIFNTQRFWSDLSNELKELDDMLAALSRRFPNPVAQEGIEGNEYKIIISLPDFEEKDIVVKAREGLLAIQASHKYEAGSERNYLDVRTLPTSVNVAGNWIFENGILRITFPLKEGAVTPETAQTSTEQVATTQQPIFEGSREEIETNIKETDQDADVGLGRGDNDKENELKTNEIPDANKVEATTYAVDLKDEVEFVPVRYR